MANSKHLAKLREGVEPWNAWRKQNPDIRPDLQEADLTKANLNMVNLNRAPSTFFEMAIDWRFLGMVDLRMADLCGASLVEAELVGANLAGAYLMGADLRMTDLRAAYLGWANFGEWLSSSKANHSGPTLNRTDLYRANLSGATLKSADLYRANLSRATLSRADLSEANLMAADLREANFASAKLDNTIFTDVNLTDVKGLESCRHHGPSTIDHRTLARSGMLPLRFLRGCGLPDTLIDYLPSLLNQPIQHFSCFISYSSEDEALAKRLHADLQDKGVRCWFAPEDMKIGDKLRVRIDEAIRTYEKLLLLLSKNSMASTWVENEVETALEREDECKEPILFPIRLDNAVMDSKVGWAAAIRRSRHIGDFCNWKNHDNYRKGLERLLRNLEIEKDAE